MAGWLKCRGEDGCVCHRPAALNHFVAGGEPSLLWYLVGGAMVLPPLPGARGGWGARGQGWSKVDCGGTMLSASRETARSHAGKIDCHCNDGSPIPPLLPLQGSPLVAGRRAFAAGRNGGAAAAPSWRAIPTVPSCQQRCHSCSKCHGIFARMGVFFCWQGEGCSNDGRGNVFELVTAKAGGKRLN